MRSVIFLSPPAAGKGTFSAYLVKNYNYVQISTGDILRERSKIDESLKNIMSSGGLVSDELIMEIVKDKLESIKGKSFILDGIPRTLNQAKELQKIFNELSINDFDVISIDVDKDILLNRVTGRVICPNCHESFNQNIVEFKPKVKNICDNCGTALVHRDDDNEESYLNRYNSYTKNTLPIINYYKELGYYNIIKNNSVDNSKALEDLRSIISDNN